MTPSQPSEGEHRWVRIGITDHPAKLLIKKPDSEGLVLVKWTNSNLTELVPVDSTKEQIAPRTRRKPNRLMSENKLPTDTDAEKGSASPTVKSSEDDVNDVSKTPESEGRVVPKWKNNGLIESETLHTTKEQISPRKRQTTVTERFLNDEGLENGSASTKDVSAAIINPITKEQISPRKRQRPVSADKILENCSASTKFVIADVINTTTKKRISPRKRQRPVSERFPTDEGLENGSANTKVVSAAVISPFKKSDSSVRVLGNDVLELEPIFPMKKQILPTKQPKHRRLISDHFTTNEGCENGSHSSNAIIDSAVNDSTIGHPNDSNECVKNQDILKTEEKKIADKNHADSIVILLKSQNKDLGVSTTAMPQEHDKEREELKKQVQVLIADKKELMFNNHNLYSALKRLQKLTTIMMEQKETESAEQEEKRSILDSRIDELKKSVLSLRQDLEEKETQFASEKQKEMDAFNKAESASQRVLSNKATHDEALQKILEAQNDELKKSVLSLRQDLEEKETQFASEKQKEMDAFNEAESASQRVLSNKATHDEALQKTLRAQNDELKKSVLSLRQDLEEKEIQFASEKQKEMDAFNEAESASPRVLSDKATTHAEALQKTLEAQNDELKKSVLSLRQDLEEKETQFASEKQKEMDAFNEAESALQRVLSNKATHDEALQKTLEGLNAELTSLSEEKKTLTNTLNEVRRKLEICQVEQTNLTLELDSAKKEKEQMNITLDKKQQELETNQLKQQASMLTMKGSLQQIMSTTSSIETEYKSQIKVLNEKLSNMSNQELTSCRIQKEVQQKLVISQASPNVSKLELMERIHVEPFAAAGAVIRTNVVQI